MKKIVIIETKSTFTDRFAIEVDEDFVLDDSEDTLKKMNDTIEDMDCYSSSWDGMKITSMFTCSIEEYLKDVDMREPYLSGCGEFMKLNMVGKIKE